jgi:quercetin dioxygenase-like cupin family protein
MIFGVSGERRELSAGELLYLEAGTPHSVEALEDCSFLLTLVLPAKA